MSDERVVHLLKRAEGCDEDALDELVHTTCQSDVEEALNSTDDEAEQEEIIGRAEHKASEINNGGFQSQIQFLIESGYSETSIREVLESRPAP